MARRKRFSIDDIFEAAFQIVRKNGIEHMTARAIAQELKSSTMPIYTCVSSMREVEESVVERAWGILQSYQSRTWSGNPYIDMGLGYVLFSKEEKYLFKCIHDESFQEINTRYSEKNFEISLKKLDNNPLFENLSTENAEKILFHGFLFSHGFASLLNSGISTDVRSLGSEAAIVVLFKEAAEFAWKGLKSVTE
jgi:AcrR family transcriptional regulator